MAKSIPFNLALPFFEIKQGAIVTSDIAVQEQRQERFRAVCKGCPDYGIITNKTHLPPFQFRRTHTPLSPITVFDLIDAETGAATDLSAHIPDLDIYTAGGSAWDYIIHDGADLTPTVLTCGIYYIRIEDAQNAYYSELIRVRDFDFALNDFLRVEWGTTVDIEPVLYTATPFTNRVFLDTFLGEQSLTFDEDAIVKEDGLTIFNRQVMRKEREADTLLVSEWLSCALAALRLYSRDGEVQIIQPGQPENKVQDICEVLPSVDYPVGECFATVNMTFIVDLPMVRNACDDDLRVLACVDLLPTAVESLVGYGDQAATEATANPGDVFLIYDDGTSPNTPPNDEFDGKESQLATWDGVGWTFEATTSNQVVTVASPASVTPSGTCAATSIFEGATIYKDGSCFRDMVELASAVHTGGCVYDLTGWVPDGYWVEVYTQQNGGGFVLKATITKAQLEATYTIGAIGAGTNDWKVKAVNYNCDLGFSRSLGSVCP